MAIKDTKTDHTFSASIPHHLVSSSYPAENMVYVEHAEESVNTLLQIVDAISDAVIVHDLSGSISMMNKQARKLCNVSSEISSKYLISDLPSYFVKYQQFSALWPEVLRGKNELVELSFLNEDDGLMVRLQISMQSAFWGGEKAILAIIQGFDSLHFNQDLPNIDQEKHENKYRSLFEKTSAAIFIYDPEGNFIEVNHAACTLLDYSRDELLRLTFWDVVLRDKLDFNPETFREMFSGNHEVVECELMKKDGNIFSAELSGSLISEGSMQVIIRDISGQKKMENELILAKEQAESHDHLKTAFLRNMNHELRTPLNAIVGFADLMPEYFDDQEKLTKFTNIIKEKGTDLIEIIDDILDFSNIDSGRIEILPTEYNMNALFSGIESYFQDYQKRLEKSQVNFRIIVSQELKFLDVVIDHEKLRQVLINLVSNAFKFTSSGSIVLGCELNEPELFTFYVSDTGIGIPKAIQNEIFNGFTKVHTDTSRIYGGTGVGLSIVQGILNLMGGKIWIESEECHGSTFYFSLPFKSIVKPEIENKAEGEYPNLSQSEFKVLIVEDNYYNTEYLLEILTDSDIPFRHTKFGQEAIRICSEEFVPVVILNVRLSDMTGFEAARQIKNIHPDTMILAQTTYANAEEMEKAINAGCVEYLNSPVKQDVLISKMNQYLQKFNDLHHH